MQRSDPSDCCCVIFNVRTGVIIIGCILWIGVIWGAIGSIIVFSALASEHYYAQPWYYFANIIFNLILAIKFCRLRASEGTGMENEFKARTRFAKAYLFFGVICTGICFVISYTYGLIYLYGTFCDEVNCHGYIYAYNY